MEDKVVESVKEYLPIGTVVMLEKDIMLYMIVGYFNRINEENVYDYIAVGYPYGLVAMESLFYFNHENVDEVIQMGMLGEEYLYFNKLLNQVNRKM